MSRFLFLTGIGRSGTTVLRTSLGQHPQIYYNGKENNIVQDLVEVAQRNCTRHSRKVAMVVDQARYEEIFRETIQSLLWPDAARRALPTLMAAINIEGAHLDHLLQIFPDAKVVALVRNGIEVVASRLRYESFASHPFKSHCRVWNRSYGVTQWGTNNPDSYRLLRHEWFYQPAVLKQKLNELYQWLNLEPSDIPFESIAGSLRHPTGDDQSIDGNNFASSSEQKKRQYFLSKRNRWNDWSEQQHELFASECGEFMKLMNYPIPWT